MAGRWSGGSVYSCNVAAVQKVVSSQVQRFRGHTSKITDISCRYILGEFRPGFHIGYLAIAGGMTTAIGHRQFRGPGGSPRKKMLAE